MPRPKELDGGSWARGRKVFFGEAAACSKCHTVNGHGGEIGPDLSNLVHRDYASVLSRHHAAELRHQPGLHRVNRHAEGRPHARPASSAPSSGKLHIGDKDGKTTIVDKADVERCGPRRFRSCRTIC